MLQARAAAAESFFMPGHQDRLLPGLRERPQVVISPHLAAEICQICVCVCIYIYYVDIDIE